MTRDSDNWQDLFSPGGPASSASVRLWVLRKDGHPFLLLPTRPRLAAQALGLYPAQTAKARLAKAVLRVVLQARLPLPLPVVSLRISAQDDFASYLRRRAGSAPPAFPPMAVLAGNARTPGRRLLVLLFGPDHKPLAVVKAGLTSTGRELIDREKSFLASVAPGTPGVPALRGDFQSPRIAAFSLDFVEGISPSSSDETAVAPLLDAWRREDQLVSVVETAAWRRLAAACPAHPLLDRLTAALAPRRVHPVLFHGDFAPWNLKRPRTGGPCVALDWERGEAVGIPGWDWFHFVLQSAILAEKLPTTAVQRRAEQLLASPAFQSYAARCRVSGAERELVLAYLIYCVEVLRPSEGLAATRALLETLTRPWANG